MSDDREGWKKRCEKLEAEVKEIKTSLIAILEGMQTAEEEIGEPLMKKGIYHGIDFTN